MARTRHSALLALPLGLAVAVPFLGCGEGASDWPDRPGPKPGRFREGRLRKP